MIWTLISPQTSYVASCDASVPILTSTSSQPSRISSPLPKHNEVCTSRRCFVNLSSPSLHQPLSLLRGHLALGTEPFPLASDSAQYQDRKLGESAQAQLRHGHTAAAASMPQRHPEEVVNSRSGSRHRLRHSSTHTEQTDYARERLPRGADRYEHDDRRQDVRDGSAVRAKPAQRSRRQQAAEAEVSHRFDISYISYLIRHASGPSSRSRVVALSPHLLARTVIVHPLHLIHRLSRLPTLCMTTLRSLIASARRTHGLSLRASSITPAIS